jgi:dolichol kinase
LLFDVFLCVLHNFIKYNVFFTLYFIEVLNIIDLIKYNHKEDKMNRNSYNSYSSWYHSYLPYFSEWWKHIMKQIHKFLEKIKKDKKIHEYIMNSTFIFLIIYIILSMITFFSKIFILIIISMIIGYFYTMY